MARLSHSLAGDQSHQKLRAALLAKHRGRHRPRRALPCHTSGAHFNASSCQRHAQQGLHLSLAVAIKTFAHITAHQTLTGIFEQRLGPQVGLQHPLGAGVHHQHRFWRGVKQDTVTGLNMPQAQIVTLHGLLGFDQATLQLGQTL